VYRWAPEKSSDATGSRRIPVGRTECMGFASILVAQVRRSRCSTGSVVSVKERIIAARSAKLIGAQRSAMTDSCRTTSGITYGAFSCAES
jgi:hypothetical protein